MEVIQTYGGTLSRSIQPDRRSSRQNCQGQCRFPEVYPNLSKLNQTCQGPPRLAKVSADLPKVHPDLLRFIWICHGQCRLAKVHPDFCRCPTKNIIPAKLGVGGSHRSTPSGCRKPKRRQPRGCRPKRVTRSSLVAGNDVISHVRQLSDASAPRGPRQPHGRSRG